MDGPSSNVRASPTLRQYHKRAILQRENSIPENTISFVTKERDEKDPFITGIFTKATHAQREHMKHTTRAGYSFHSVNSAEGGGQEDRSTGLRDKVKSHFEHLLTTRLGEIYSTHPTFCFIFWKMILMMPASRNCF